MDWKDVAAKVTELLPAAGATLGGPLGAGVGIAIKALAGVFGIQNASPQPQEVMAAISGDPQAILKLEQARISFEQEKMRLDHEGRIKELESAYKDTDSARNMQIQALQQSDPFAKQFVYWFAAFLTGTALLYIFLITFWKIPEQNVRFADTVLGFFLGTVVASILQFFFGSSIGSKIKGAKEELSKLFQK
jgi:hypothetical protein